MKVFQESITTTNFFGMEPFFMILKFQSSLENIFDVLKFFHENEKCTMN